jgi:hypothetical protein
MRASESVYPIDGSFSPPSVSAALARFFDDFLLDAFFFDALVLLAGFAGRFFFSVAAAALRLRLLAGFSSRTGGAKASSSSSLIR